MPFNLLVTPMVTQKAQSLFNLLVTHMVAQLYLIPVSSSNGVHSSGPFHTNTASRYIFSTTFRTPVCAVITVLLIDKFSTWIAQNDKTCNEAFPARQLLL